MNDIISSPVFGVLVSLAAYEIGAFIREKTKMSIFNPLLIAIIVLVVFLTKLHISYDDYNKGGQIISFFLAPATVALALPFYKKFSLFKQNAVPILAGLLSGTVCGIISIIALSKMFGLSDVLTVSLIPKSITTPIGMALSKQLGGLTSITVMAIIITGILGSIISPVMCKVLKLNDKVAIGTAIGTSSHAVGTSKAMEMGETEGAMSSLAMALCGVITVILAPVICKIFLAVFK